MACLGFKPWFKNDRRNHPSPYAIHPLRSIHLLRKRFGSGRGGMENTIEIFYDLLFKGQGDCLMSRSYVISGWFLQVRFTAVVDFMEKRTLNRPLWLTESLVKISFIQKNPAFFLFPVNRAIILKSLIMETMFPCR